MKKKIVKTALIFTFMGVALGLVTGAVTGAIPGASDSTLPMEETSSVIGTGLAPTVSAKGAILIDAKDGQVIYEKNADEKLYPASTTKIMTALTVFQILEETDTNLDSCVIIPKEAVGIEGSSVYLKAGEKLTIRELMYGMMLQSGNDAAAALAICCGGTMENFIDKMNRNAEKLGCDSTNFANPNGLFDENHYTSARDLARISREAMKNEEFRHIVSAEKWQSEESGRIFVNKNKTVSQYEGATGIKIGYTKASGRTLAASAKRGETELIAVVLNDSDWFNDAYAMMDYGFSRREASREASRDASREASREASRDAN